LKKILVVVEISIHVKFVNILIRWIQVTERKIKTEVFSRVSGYFRPVQNWNKGKKEEFRERKFADVKALQMPENGNVKRLDTGQ